MDNNALINFILRSQARKGSTLPIRELHRPPILAVDQAATALERGTSKMSWSSGQSPTPRIGMTGTFDLDTFLDQWQQQRQKQKSLSPDDFVRQVGGALTPEQVVKLRQAIRDLLDINNALAVSVEDEAPGDPDTTAAGSLRSGQTLTAAARFRVSPFHDRGGLGEVYVAEDEPMGREVALKVIQPSRAAIPEPRTLPP